MDYDRNDSRVDEPWKEDESGASNARSKISPLDSRATVKQKAASFAKSLGRSAEENASDSFTDSSNSAQESENTPLYRGKGSSSTFSYTGKGLTGKKFKAKVGFGVAPLAALIFTVVIIGVLFAGAQFGAAFSWIANASDMDNTQRTPFNLSTNTLVDATLEGNSSAANESSEGNIYDHLDFSAETQTRLKNNGIYYVTSGGSRALVYQHPTTKQWMAVTANSKAPGAFVGQTIAINDETSVPISVGLKLDDAYKDSQFFANDFDTAFRPTKGHVAGWWDKSAKMYTSQIGNSRNKFIEYTQATPEFNQLSQAIEKNGAAVAVEGISSGSTILKIPCVPTIFGKEQCEDDGSGSWGTSSLKKGMTKEETHESISERAMAVMMSGADQEASNECKSAKAVAAVSAAGTAIGKIQILNSGTAFFEAIDKAKAGYGGGPLNAYMNKLSEKGETKWLNDQSEWETVEGKTATSALESPAWNFVAGDGPPLPPDDPMVKTFSMDSVIGDSYSYNNQLKERVKDYSDAGVEKCTSVTQYGGASDLYYNNEGSGPTGNLFASLANFVRVVLENIFGDSREKAEQIADVTTKRTYEILNMDIEEMTGESKAYVYLAAINLNDGQKAIMNSGTIGTEELLTAQWKDTQKVIAREAEVTRSLKSPFDITSKDTFLGSIVYSALPILSKISTPASAFSSFIGTTFSSFRSLIPIAGAAADENYFKETLREDCPTSKYLTSITGGTAASDAFCGSKAYQNTSEEVIKTKPREVYQKILYGASDGYRDIPNFIGTDSDGNPKVNPKGEYATWLVSCTVKKSQWGYISGQSSSFIQEQRFGGNAASLTNSSIEKGLEKQNIDDIKTQAYPEVYDRSSLDWASGLNCMGGRDQSLLKQTEMYAQFNTYQNSLEIMGNISTAASTAFLQDYYDEHPFYRDSIEGVIAEYSGLSLDDVNLALGYIEYYDYIAHYDPTDRAPLDPIPEKSPLFFEQTTVIASVIPEATIVTDPQFNPRRESLITA